MYRSRMGVVSEVKARKVEEVDNEDELCPDEVGADKEHDECEVKEVVDYKVGTNSSGRVDVVSVVRKERPDIASLANEKCEPVERGNEGIQGEWRWM
jgi:hypothetical protein